MSEREDGAARGARALLAAAAQALAEAGARDEALAELRPAGRRLGIMRPIELRPLGRVWRLGVLLLEPDGRVRATGSVTRAVPPGHPGHVAASVEQRREIRAAAFRGRFTPGASVHFDAPILDLEPQALLAGGGPLLLRGGAVLVRWSPALGDDAATPLEPYLRERVALLLHPPQGA